MNSFRNDPPTIHERGYNLWHILNVNDVGLVKMVKSGKVDSEKERMRIPRYFLLHHDHFRLPHRKTLLKEHSFRSFLFDGIDESDYQTYGYG